MQTSTSMHRVLIVGGGFGGITAAQKLARSGAKNLSIRLVDPKSYMEYHAAIYRLVTGRSPMESCIPYADLLQGCDVELVKDAIVSVDLHKKVAVGTSGSDYSYDSLILAVGSETSYFGIEGIKENAYGIKTVDEALRLKRHIHQSFEDIKTTENKTPALHIVVIGGGASGVELAGELAAYTQVLAQKHGVDSSFITIDLIEAMPRLLPMLPERVSKKVLWRLRKVGVNVYLNRSVVKEEMDRLFLKDMEMTAKTVVWTAGMKANSLASKIAGIPVDKRGRVQVTNNLTVEGQTNVYVIGDAAATKYSGMAQTAIADAKYVSRSILAFIKGSTISAYRQPAPAYSVPVGPKWAATVYHGMQFFGRMGWILRRAADFRAFLTLLSIGAAFHAFLGGETRIEACPVCEKPTGVY